MAKKSIENRNVTLRQKKDKGPAGREALFQDLPWGPITPLTLAISRRSVVGVVQRARTNMTSIDRCTRGTGSQACRGWGVPRRTICERGGGGGRAAGQLQPKSEGLRPRSAAVRAQDRMEVPAQARSPSCPCVFSSGPGRIGWWPHPGEDALLGSC